MQTWPNFGFTVAYVGSGGSLSLTPVAGAIAFTGYAPTVASGTSTITPSIVEARSSGVAPLSVFFDASGTTAVSLTSKPFHELVYVWSFGDTAGGATWTYGARAGLSKNQAFGPVASHVFETAGSYTVTLTVFHYDSGGTMSSASTTKSITVTDADTYFSGTNTIVFATDGVFTGKPTGAQEVTTSDYATAINTYRGTGKRLLFKKGQTFTATADATINVDGPGIVGAWGTGAIPKFQPSAGMSSAIQMSTPTTPTIKDWRLMDIEIDCQDVAKGIRYGGGIDQTLLLRLNIHNLASTGVTGDDQGLDYANTHGTPGNAIWDQLAIVDSTINTVNGGVATAGMTAIYIAAKRVTYMGNTFDNVNGGEHVIRTPYVGGGVISNNYLARPDAPKHCLKLHGPDTSVGGVIGGLYTENVVISDNTFKGGFSVQIIAIQPQNTAVDERLRNIIIERNFIKIESSVGITARGPVSSLTIRNNILDSSLLSSGYQIGFEVWDDGVGPAIDNVYFYSNTMYGSGTGTFKMFDYGPDITTIECKNNIGYAPNASQTYLVFGESGASNVAASNNSSNGQFGGTSPLFSSIPATSATQLASTDFKITSGSYAIDSGAYLAGVYRDFQDVVRTLPADIGAVQA